MYIDDGRWKKAKKYVGTYDWMEVVSVYHELGGTQVQLHCVLGEESYRFIDFTDSGKAILYNPREDKIILADNDESLKHANKYFLYQAEPKPTTYRLPDNEEIYQENNITIYG